MKESQLENKTAIATNDYVRMVDENGNSVKIKKDSFMAAIRDALPSIISDGETGGGSVLSIINGALKTRTDANLASVLGVFVGDLGGDGYAETIDNAKTYWSSMTDTSFAAGYMNGTSSAYVMLWKANNTYGRIELRYRATGALEIYNKPASGNTWTKLQ